MTIKNVLSIESNESTDGYACVILPYGVVYIPNDACIYFVDSTTIRIEI